MKIGPKHALAINSLLAGKTVRGAAQAAGVSEMTLSRWQHDRDFQNALAEAVQRVFGHGIHRLQTVVSKAVSTLEKALNGKRDTLSIRAALGVLQHAIKSKELLELTERIAALESAHEKEKLS